METPRQTELEILDTSDTYPKTLAIRNHRGGGIWQVYHVNNMEEALFLSKNAMGNGFWGVTLEHHQPEHKETWPNWRNEQFQKNSIRGW